ncbi:N-acetyltransferase [Streptomyces lucensis JCM 4490]|uniref:N-acetyltransferase n=1 Tax=Streptomyces lucensis JCM 4490 TaxID=1306176 RepID=A0A918MLI5_9ACTN|nr:GNAT family N-acetyltransferase [Streptomyces lucensis]GGW33574.1 N-acetyltransferase [Streptomyces lucensis JCM 4490]
MTTDTAALLAAYDAQIRATPPAPPPGVTHEYDGRLLRIVGEFRGFLGTPPDLGLRGRDLDELIARQRDFFAARGEAVEWKLRGHDVPADLPDRLSAAGFVPEEEETVLIAPVAELAAGEPAPPDGVTLRRVTSAADVHRIAALQTAVWDQDMSWLAEHLLGRLATEPDDLSVHVAEADGEIVSAAWLSFRPGTEFAGLLGGSTLAEWRGKGIYRALVAARAGLAAARGVRYLHVDASADSAPILRRLGFRAVTTTTPYVWSPYAEATG